MLVKRKVHPLLDTLRKVLPLYNPLPGHYYPGARLRNWLGVWADYSANLLTANFYPVMRTIRFDRIAIAISGAGGAGAAIRMGIYADDGFKPGKLLLDAGTVPATAVDWEADLPIDVTLRPGVYWLAFVTNDGTIDLSSVDVFMSIGISPTDFRHQFGQCTRPYTYGPLPDQFGASTYGGNMVAMFLRVKEVLG